jgi:Asp-tRNA(Asn)/Glu-tRNA(Gln) amidotransferase A subunit family amidase
MTGSRNSDLASLTLAQAASRLRGHQVTSVDLTEACLERIDVYNPKLDSFITVTKPQALAAARQADLEIQAGKYRGTLHGIPFAAKDNIDTAGVKTTGGSALFADRVPVEDATVIDRLKAAGAVLLGKTNLQEFALGASNNSDWGPVRNPWNLLHYGGGSSSGSGAAVTAYIDYVAGMEQSVNHFRLGIPTGHFDGLQPEVEKAVMEAIALLATITRGTKEMTLPPLGNAVNLEPEILAWHEQYFKTQPDKYSAPVRRCLAVATATNARAEDYIRAVWALQELRRRVDHSFSEVDLVVLPTTRVVAPPIGELLQRDANPKPGDSLKDYPSCIFFNVYGLPAVSVPCGFSKTGLPIGLTIAGPHFSESRILALADAYEKATDWHQRIPPLTPDTPVPQIDVP